MKNLYFSYIRKSVNALKIRKAFKIREGYNNRIYFPKIGWINYRNMAIIVFYDNYCANCTRFIKLVKKLDWFHAIEEKQLRDKALIEAYLDIDQSLALKKMPSYNGKCNYGFISIYLILSRIPLFWIFYPFLWIFKITGFGEILYKEFAVNRKIIPLHCDEDSCNI